MNSSERQRVRVGDVREMPDGRRVRVTDVYREGEPMANLIGEADGRTFSRACSAAAAWEMINDEHEIGR